VWYAVNGAGRKAGDPARIAVSGQKAAAFLSVVLGTDVAALADGAEVNVLGCNRQALCAAKVTKGADGFALDVPADRATHVTQWLRALSDGYVIFDDANVGTDIPGPVAIE
jgi:folate-binding Fe-S cluster repair protein YgfZ